MVECGSGVWSGLFHRLHGVKSAWESIACNWNWWQAAYSMNEMIHICRGNANKSSLYWVILSRSFWEFWEIVVNKPLTDR